MNLKGKLLDHQTHCSSQPFRRSKAVSECIANLQRFSGEIVADTLSTISLENSSGSSASENLLSMLIESNLQEPSSGRLNDEEVRAQIVTFVIGGMSRRRQARESRLTRLCALLAGYETTAAAITWTLYELSKNTNIQTKLRDELLTLPNDDPTFDKLNALTYLDFVVKETLRRHPAGAVNRRTALEDVRIPLPEPILDKNGIMITEILWVASLPTCAHVFFSQYMKLDIC